MRALGLFVTLFGYFSYDRLQRPPRSQTAKKFRNQQALTVALRNAGSYLLMAVQIVFVVSVYLFFLAAAGVFG